MIILRRQAWENVKRSCFLAKTRVPHENSTTAPAPRRCDKFLCATHCVQGNPVITGVGFAWHDVPVIVVQKYVVTVVFTHLSLPNETRAGQVDTRGIR